MAYYRKLDSVVEAIKRSKKEGIKINLLIGAGCSQTSGIPVASGMVEYIQEKYSTEIEYISEKTYSNYMAKLTPIERRKLINDFVKKSKINWAHIGIAQMMKENFIDRILTTNFDNILLRACSLIGEFPGIYDMTTYGGNFRSDLLSEKSILYLHGQHTSFVLCNTDEEVEEQRKNLKDTFDELKRNSMWIIVGYSCTNDAIWQLLSREPSFENRLYLIGYENENENENMKEILSEEKYAFYVKGYNADSFFVDLMKYLNIFPPKIIDNPFSYLSETISSITEYKDDKSFLSSQLNVTTLEILDDAIKNYEEDHLRMSKYYFQLGLFEKFNNRIKKIDEDRFHEIVEFVTEYESKINEEVKSFILDNKNSTNVDNTNISKLRQATEFIIIDRVNIGSEEIELIKIIDDIYNKLDLDILEYDDIINWVKCIIIKIEFDDSLNKMEELNRAEIIYKSKITNKKQDKIILNELAKLYLKMAKFDEINVNNYIKELLSSIEEAYRRDSKDIGILIDWGTYLLNIIQFIEEEWKEFYYNAKYKFDEAAKLVESKEYYKVMSIYAKKLFDISFEYNNKEIKERCIKDFMQLYCNIYLNEKFYNINNNSWERMINKLIKTEDRNNYINLVESYFNTVELVVTKYKHEKEISSFITNVNNVSYTLVQRNELELAEKIINFCIEVDEKNSFPKATKGLWYFKNDKLNEELREKCGKNYYKEAIELSGNDTDLNLAFRQKYYFEYGVFLYEVKNDFEEGARYLKLAKGFGRIERYSSNYIEVNNYIIKNGIKIKDIDYDSEVAVGEVIVDE